jgi:hypothetical protein
MRNTAGTATVSMMPRTKIYTDGLVLRGSITCGAGILTDCFGPPVSGAINCAIPEPTGFMTAITIVAVVLPRRLNHDSLYFAGITWKMACGMLAKNLEIIRVRYSCGVRDVRGWWNTLGR